MISAASISMDSEEINTVFKLLSSIPVGESVKTKYGKIVRTGDLSYELALVEEIETTQEIDNAQVLFGGNQG